MPSSFAVIACTSGATTSVSSLAKFATLKLHQRALKQPCSCTAIELCRHHPPISRIVPGGASSGGSARPLSASLVSDPPPAWEA
jgi:hypothetical protein